MAKIHIRVLKRIVKSRALKKKELKEITFKRANAIFQRKKRRMLAEFDAHPVTREIQGGENAGNVTGSLGGYGNLYSFIGFNKGEDPTDVVRRTLDSRTRMLKTPKINETKKTINYEYRVKVATKDQIDAISPMPWEPGSWVFKIERGISGLGYYIHEQFLRNSRSGTGVQSTKQLKSAIYKRQKYMSQILTNFKRGLR